eukprot:1140405-Pelagomonas_calceolata.AAC.2
MEKDTGLRETSTSHPIGWHSHSSVQHPICYPIGWYFHSPVQHPICYPIGWHSHSPVQHPMGRKGAAVVADRHRQLKKTRAQTVMSKAGMMSMPATKQIEETTRQRSILTATRIVNANL